MSSDSGQWEVYIQPFPGPGSRILVSTGGGAQPRWRADGRELLFLTLDGTLMAVEIKAGVNRAFPGSCFPHPSVRIPPLISTR
jgi:Tol biopolymer transport system component